MSRKSALLEISIEIIGQHSPIFSFSLGAFLLPEKACEMSFSFFFCMSNTRSSTVSSATSWKTRTL